MLKVLGFVRRNDNITHDEYRAGHVGYHNSFGRRLNHIRGYLLNVRANVPLEQKLDAQLLQHISFGEPDDFDGQWDGWGQLLFDSYDHYITARAPARDLAGPDGLVDDPGVAGVGGDFDYLYSGSPFQYHADEHVAVPVIRPERKLFKLAQFVKRPQGLAPELFRAYLTGRYASLIANPAVADAGLHGLVINLRTPLDVMTGFFATDAEGFTTEGIARRERFYAGFDALIEYWLDGPTAFEQIRTAHSNADELLEMERSLFENSFYREVDETVAVLPNRAPAPDFYFR